MSSMTLKHQILPLGSNGIRTCNCVIWYGYLIGLLLMDRLFFNQNDLFVFRTYSSHPHKHFELSYSKFQPLIGNLNSDRKLDQKESCDLSFHWIFKILIPKSSEDQVVS